jgi:cytochrome oxidase Cu insertion factor (SCO1/SenC/PrrC family)
MANNSGKSPKSAGAGWLMLAGILAVLALGLGGRYLMMDKPAAPVQVSVGGPFALTDHHGKAVTDANYRGKYLLILFGYTFCPDVCPTGLQTITLALKELGADAGRIQPLFISVDPERDTVSQLAAYVTNFDPRLIGLTGSKEQVAAAAKAFRVYFAKVNDKGDGAYLVDHSAVIYLVGPDGRYLRHFTHSTTPEDLAAGIKKLL